MTGFIERGRRIVNRSRQHLRLSSDVTRATMSSVLPIVLMALVISVEPAAREGLTTLPGQVMFMLVFVIVTFGLYVSLTLVAFARLAPKELEATIRASEARRNPRLERLLAMDQMSWILTAVGFALVLIGLTVTDETLRRDPRALACGALLVVLSWLLMAVAASVHLMRLDVDRCALRFPDESPRVFSDYF